MYLPIRKDKATAEDKSAGGQKPIISRKERFFATARVFAISGLSFVFAVLQWWIVLREIHRQYGGRTMV